METGGTEFNKAEGPVIDLPQEDTFVITLLDVKNLLSDFYPGGSMMPKTSLVSLGNPYDQTVAKKISDWIMYYGGASHIIDKEEYQHVYITGDIHADLNRLHNMLVRNQIVIEQPFPGNPADLDAYRRHIACTTQWSPQRQRTLLILVGDLIDGRRMNDDWEVDDPVGSLELLLHIYLYNLRISAHNNNSELRFTFGNHDYHTVIEAVENPDLTILPPHPNASTFYERYVHRSAKAFFQTRGGRRDCLLPFYHACPYLFLNVSNEIACIHGGFHDLMEDPTGTPVLYNFINAIQQIQTEIDDSENFLEDIQNIHQTRGLWSRWYAETEQDTVCNEINTNDTNPYKLIAVGHCPTNSQMAEMLHGDALRKQTTYIDSLSTLSNCQRANGGCVLTGCNDPQPGPPPPGGNPGGNPNRPPRLAFVDMGLSSCFTSSTNPAKNAPKREEMLYLFHDAALSSHERYYNTIVRVNGGGDGSDLGNFVWREALAAAGGGGRKKKTRRNRHSYRKNKRRSKMRNRKTMRRGLTKRHYKPKRRL